MLAIGEPNHPLWLILINSVCPELFGASVGIKGKGNQKPVNEGHVAQLPSV